jgi:hypothetical protein
MRATTSRLDQIKLDRALADIREFISEPKAWHSALKQLSAIKDYGMGEERFCSADAALRHCQEIKSLFPPNTPEHVIRNLDAIADEIQHLQSQDIPPELKLALNPYVILCAAGVIIYLVFFR